MDCTLNQDAVEIVRGLKLIQEPGQVTELRVLDAVTASDRRPHVESGYFDDVEKLARAAATIKSAKGFYIVPNPVNPALLARAANRIRAAGKDPTTADHDVLARRWLLIDIDSKRPAGISASDSEHDAAIERAFYIRAALSADGWPDPIVNDSGNGAHLLYRIDLPRDDGELVKRCLEALAQRFDTDAIKVDTSVHNPARIWKLSGTVSAKGDNTPERPHRMAHVLESPEHNACVEIALLEALAASAPSKIEPPTSVKSSGQPFNIDQWIYDHGVKVDGPQPWQGGRKWVFPVCPWNSDHTNRSAFLLQQSSGAIAAGCHHNGCHGKGWHELRDVIEPGWRALKASPIAQNTAATGMVESIPGQPFPVEVLPAAVARYVTEAATAIGCDPSYVALPLFCCLARAIGNKRTIRLKRTWHEFPIIWAAIVGKSGTHKTPAVQAATSDLQRKQAEAMAQHDEHLARYERELAEYERAMAIWKRSKSTEPPPWEPEKPHCPRYIVGDITIEALADRLGNQFDGVLVVRDELAGWVDGIGEYKNGKSSDTGHWLAAWSAAPLTVDRKTGAKSMIHIPRASVSICGGIQPGILRRAIFREHLHDGLCARLLLAMPEPRPIRWSEAIVNPATEAALSEVVDKLLALEPAADEDGNPAPFAMPLTPEGKTAWILFYNRHRAELAGLDDDLAAAWSKLEAYAARFALIFQLCTWASGEAVGDHVDETSVVAGIALADWFGNEARRVYSVLVETDEERDHRELIELIRRLGGKITPRQLAHASTRHRAPGEAEAALERLIKAGQGRWQLDHATGGRPANAFVLFEHSNVGNGNERPENPGEIGGSVTLPGHDGRDDAEINRLLAEAGEGEWDN